MITTFSYSLKGPINWPLMTEQARTVFGQSFVDCNATSDGLIATLYLEDTQLLQTKGPDPLGTWANLVAAHDAAELTADQQKEVDKAHAIAALAALDKTKLDSTLAYILIALGI